MAPAIFIAVFVAFIVGGALVIYLSDRRLAMGRAGRIGAQEPALPMGTPVDVFVDPTAATQMARTAIQRIGGRDVGVQIEQQNWVEKTAKDCPDMGCLTQAFDTRMADLQSRYRKGG